MILQILLWLGGSLAGALVALYLWTCPLLRRLPTPAYTTIDGVTTIDDAVAACQHSGRQGWPLVTYAQQLTARKFIYARLNPWDSPARAFRRGRGYCQQQALALKAIYDRLELAARPVYAMRCRFPARDVDGRQSPAGIGPHTWLRVRIGADEHDVCPGATGNRPGRVHFEALSPIRPLHWWLRPFSHLGSVVENIRRDTRDRRQLHAS